MESKECQQRQETNTIVKRSKTELRVKVIAVRLWDKNVPNTWLLLNPFYMEILELLLLYMFLALFQFLCLFSFTKKLH